MATFFANRPIVAMVISIMIVMVGLVALGRRGRRHSVRGATPVRPLGYPIWLEIWARGFRAVDGLSSEIWSGRRRVALAEALIASGRSR